MFLTGPSVVIASSMTKAIIWLLGKCFSRGHERSGLPVCREEPGAGRIINQGRGLALV